MQELRSFSEVHDYLSGLMSETRSRREAYTLDNMRALMAHLGNPQDSYKTVHVAGTSGKSSTCYYLSAMLSASGKKVGLGISPHVSEVNERVQINTQPLDEQTFCGEFSLFLRIIGESGVEPTYFELLVAFAFWEFARQGVDYAVIEVGLGGLLDGTNVMTRTDKVCVITDIGFDHTATLGKTLPAIAAQKAGIILSGNVVFSYEQPKEVMQVFRDTCAEERAELHEVTPNGSRLDLPLFQQRNWYLAKTVYDHLALRDGLPVLSQDQLKQTVQTLIPARMETIPVGGKTLILDGAHNPQKLEALVDSVRHAYPVQPIACLAAFARTKQSKIHDDLHALLPIVAHLIITSFHDDKADHHSKNPQTIVEECETLGYQTYELVGSPEQALETLLNRPEPILLVTGSFFLIQHLRPLIINTNDQVNRRH